MDNFHFSDHTIFAIELVKMASRILIKGYNSSYKISYKEGIHNLVTEYDLKSEKAIIDAIKEKYPKAQILSEEVGKVNEQNKMLWIIDPLDGTVNYAHHIPFFCVTIALSLDSSIVTGVTFCPITNELFVAEKGKGAFLNEKKINVSSTPEIQRAILATGFPYNLKNNPEKCIDRFIEIIKTGIPIRRLGSAALDLAYLAAGRFDGYWETNLGPWDCASGLLLIEEAGGKISDWKGNKFQINTHNSLVGSNNKIHESLINILKKS